MALFESMVGGLAGSALTGFLNNSGAQDRQDDANAFSAHQYATRYQTTVKDMEAAGLNPMLAYSGISGSPPSGAIANPGGYPDFGQTYNQSLVSSAQAANLEADTRNKDRQNALIDATTDKIKAETSNLGSMQEQIKATVLNLEQQRQNMIKEGWNLTEQGNVLRGTVDRLKADVFRLASETSRNDFQSALYRVQTELGGYDVKAAREMGNIGREAGQLKPIFDILRGLLRR